MLQHQPFVYEGVALATIGQLQDCVDAIAAREDEQEAERFMEAYRLHTEHADENIGYLSGYHDPVSADRFRHLFGVPHPLTGWHANATATELLLLGALSAEQGFRKASELFELGRTLEGA